MRGKKRNEKQNVKLKKVNKIFEKQYISNKNK